jgi:cystinosin
MSFKKSSITTGNSKKISPTDFVLQQHQAELRPLLAQLEREQEHQEQLLGSDRWYSDGYLVVSDSDDSSLESSNRLQDCYCSSSFCSSCEDIRENTYSKNGRTDRMTEPVVTSGPRRNMLGRVESLGAKCHDMRVQALSDDSEHSDHIVWGLSLIFVVGTILGIILPTNPDLNGAVYPYISSAMGYTYFLSWSLFYYPQAISNYLRQSTQGLSPDFCFLQLYGYGCYTVQNCALYFSETAQQLYRDRHGGFSNMVESNDVAFGIHSVLLCSVWIFQLWYYNGRTFQSCLPSNGTAVLLSTVAFLFVGYAGLIMFHGSSIVLSRFPNLDWVVAKLNWLDFIYVVTSFSVVSIMMSFWPQAVMNCRRQSTTGFNSLGVLLDFVGGSLSILQLYVDAMNQHDRSAIQGDVTKLYIGSIYIFYDLLFLTQRYILYPPPKRGRGEIVNDKDDQRAVESGKRSDDTESPNSSFGENEQEV